MGFFQHRFNVLLAGPLLSTLSNMLCADGVNHINHYRSLVYLLSNTGHSLCFYHSEMLCLQQFLTLSV